MWKQLSPLKLSELALKSGIQIDLNDSTMEIVEYNDGERFEQFIENKDEPLLEVSLTKNLFKRDGQI